MKKIKLHYGWAVAFACLLMFLCNMGFSSNVIAVFIPFIEQSGLSGSQGSSLVSIRCLTAFLTTFFVVSYYNRMSLRTGCFIATALYAFSCLINSIGGSAVVYYIGAAVSGVAFGLGTTIPMALLMNNWFNSKKGLAMGLCSTGSGIANAVFAPVATNLIINHGLRFAFLFFAVFSFICAIVIFLIIRDHPEDLGMEPYGGKFANEYVESPIDNNIRIPPLWWVLFAVMMTFEGAVGNTAMSHVSILTISSGYDAYKGALVTTIVGIALVIGKFIIGDSIDRFGARKTSVVGLLCFASACFVTLSLDGRNQLAPVAFATLLGLGSGIHVLGFPMWAKEFSSPVKYKNTMKWFQLFHSGGGIILSSVPGRIADVTGEYVSSYLILGVMTIILTIIMRLGYFARKHEYWRKT